MKYKLIKRLIYCTLLFYFMFAIFSCNNSEYEIKTVDFANTINQTIQENDTNQDIEVVIGAMISPKETFSNYKELFEYITSKLDKKLTIVQRKSYSESNELLTTNQVKVGFICSGAYIKIRDKCDLLVVPVFNNHPYYQAYIITNKSSSIKNFNDLKGRSFAFTDALSNTGKFYPEKRIKELFNTNSHYFFSKTTYSNSHDASIQLVEKGLVDGASIDGLIYEYMLKYTPKKVQNINIIEKSECFGSPPVVVSKNISKSLKFNLKNIFLNMQNDSMGKKILQNLMIDKFIIPNDSIYNSIIQYYKNLNSDIIN